MRTQPIIARASRIGRVDMNFDCHLVHGDRCCTRAVGKATYIYIYTVYIPVKGFIPGAKIDGNGTREVQMGEQLDT